MSFVHTTEWDTPQARTALARSPGRKPGQLAGTYIGDLAACDKAISLCTANCAPKFDAKRAGYETHKGIPFARGVCDGCGDHSPQNRLFVRSGSFH